MSTSEPTTPSADEVLADPQGPETVTEVVATEVEVVDLVPAPAHGYPLLARIAAEAFGSFALVLVAVGALLYTQLSGAGTLGVALATGLVLTGLTLAFGHVSGAHLTPAVSVGAAIAGRVPTVDAILYVVAQVLGAVVAVVALVVTIPAALPAAIGADSGLAMIAATANGFDAGSPLSTLSSGQVTFGLTSALIVELLGTAIVVAVVLANRARRSGAVAVGLTFAALLVVAAPVTNGALNPARAMAVALVAIGTTSTPLAQVWLFWLTGLLGGAAAGLGVLAFGRRDAAVLEESYAQDAEEAFDDEETVDLR